MQYSVLDRYLLSLKKYITVVQKKYNLKKISGYINIPFYQKKKMLTLALEVILKYVNHYSYIFTTQFFREINFTKKVRENDFTEFFFKKIMQERQDFWHYFTTFRALCV